MQTYEPADEPDPELEGAEPVAPPTASPRAARMHMRFDAVEAARDALIAGDLEAATRAGDSIAARITLHDMPSAARAWGDDVPRRATALAAAETLEGASLAFANLVMTCGRCHEAAGATWSWVETPAPEGDDLAARMARHRWGVERMWEGMLVASTERFDRGAAALAGTPLSGDSAPDLESPPGVRAFEERLRARAREAQSAADLTARAAIYADLLATCAGCHQLVER